MVEVLYLSGVVLLGSVLQRVTGLGFALVVAPLLVLVLGPVQGVVVTVAFGLVFSAVVFVLHAREVEYRRVLPILAWAVVGIVPAALLVRLIPSSVLSIWAGVLMVLALLISMLAYRVRTPNADRGWMRLAAGAISGVMNVVAGAGGPPLAAYAVASRWDHARFAVSAQFYFMVLGAFSLLGRWVVPEISYREAIGGCVGVLLGVLLARVVRRRVSATASRVLCMILAFGGSIAVIVSGIQELLGR